MHHAGQVSTKPEANEINLINCHDGASPYLMLAGMFRSVRRGPWHGDGPGSPRLHQTLGRLLMRGLPDFEVNVEPISRPGTRG